MISNVGTKATPTSLAATGGNEDGPTVGAVAAELRGGDEAAGGGRGVLHLRRPRRDRRPHEPDRAADAAVGRGAEPLPVQQRPSAGGSAGAQGTDRGPECGGGAGPARGDVQVPGDARRADESARLQRGS